MNFSRFFLTLRELNDSCFTLLFFTSYCLFPVLGHVQFQRHRLNRSSVQHAFIVATESYLFGPRTRSIKRFVADTGCRINEKYPAKHIMAERHGALEL